MIGAPTGGADHECRLFMLSLADTDQYYQVLLSQGVGAGLGSGLIFSPALSVQAHHWKRRRALAMGVVLSGWSLVNALFDSTLIVQRRYILRRSRLPDLAQQADQWACRLRMGSAGVGVPHAWSAGRRQPHPVDAHV